MVDHKSMNQDKTIFDWLPDIYRDRVACCTLEIGTGHGGDTERIWTASGAEKSVYIAFEPDLRNVTRFMGVHSGKPIQLIHSAVAERCGLTAFYASNPKTECGSIKKPVMHLTKWPEVEFPVSMSGMVVTVTLDEIVQALALSQIDFIWADVQGSEDLLIAGGSKALQRTRWFYTEYYNEEVYAGQASLERIHKGLPGDWEMVQKWETDALFRNKVISV